MIKFLKHIKNHNKIESIQIILEVIEVLEKNYNADYTLTINEWNIVTKWLEKYYCELKELYKDITKNE